MSLRDAHRLLLGAAALFLLLGGCSGSSSHSLRFHVAMWDSAEGLPQFIGQGYLDDQIFGHCDEKIRQPMPVVPWMKKLMKDDPEHWNLYIRDTARLDETLRQHVVMVQRYGNQSEKPPVVKVLQKMDSNGLETLICRAYGFYPREIRVTWKKDGEFLEQETHCGEVIPNSDGTYHTWTGFNIDPKDRSRYQCQVEHVGFPEPHLFAWKEPASVGPIVGGILGAVAAVVLLVAAIIFYMKKQQGGYKATSAEGPSSSL
ncbi:major histocompatibility complex class I-related gene protein-like isoform X2 [Hemicordylus capensis]|uniref:major histocompatibility complex class I-related gene protein-like isoform X2 n=1 Tax=Hemicordylus capensis TaxID=884348 RepID=UPI002303A09D|nr:major histocompatibility complex class I-related gene protein-like isoform X2 [Hemicordylus capensis]